MKDSNAIKYFWLGFGVGAAAITVIAPKSGAETRRYFQTRAHDTASLLRHQANDIRNRAAKTTEQRKAQVRAQLEKFSRAMDAGRRAFKQAS